MTVQGGTTPVLVSHALVEPVAGHIGDQRAVAGGAVATRLCQRGDFLHHALCQMQFLQLRLDAQTGQVAGEDVISFDDGRYEVPYIGMTPISVTEKNIKEAIIDSGFHLKEDVYLNVPGKMPK